MVIALHTNDKHVLFFDIDGVLLEPIGYRKATVDTIENFFQDCGVDQINILEEEIAAFESQGITSEWDIIPLYILTWLEVNSHAQRDQQSALNWQKLIETQKISRENHVSNLDLILQSGQFLLKDMSPSNSFAMLFADKVLSKKYFPNMANQQWAIHELLNKQAGSFSTGLIKEFQKKIHGTKINSQDDENNRLFSNDSYLKMYDRRLIDVENSAYLHKINVVDGIAMAAMTARPSQVSELDSYGQIVPFNYPETETGLELAGLGFLPVAGFGEIQLVSLLTDLNEQKIRKPAYLHAVIALFRALCIPMRETLDFISSQLDSDRLFINLLEVDNPYFRELLTNQEIIHLHVFEDSSVGIRAVRGLQSLFYRNGIYAVVHAYGISQDERKIQALRNENACIYPSINQAIISCKEIIC